MASSVFVKDTGGIVFRYLSKVMQEKFPVRSLMEEDVIALPPRSWHECISRLSESPKVQAELMKLADWYYLFAFSCHGRLSLLLHPPFVTGPRTFRRLEMVTNDIIQGMASSDKLLGPGILYTDGSSVAAPSVVIRSVLRKALLMDHSAFDRIVQEIRLWTSSEIDRKYHAPGKGV